MFDDNELELFKTRNCAGAIVIIISSHMLMRMHVMHSNAKHVHFLNVYKNDIIPTSMDIQRWDTYLSHNRDCCTILHLDNANK